MCNNFNKEFNKLRSNIYKLKIKMFNWKNSY